MPLDASATPSEAEAATSSRSGSRSRNHHIQTIAASGIEKFRRNGNATLVTADALKRTSSATSAPPTPPTRRRAYRNTVSPRNR